MKIEFEEPGSDLKEFMTLVSSSLAGKHGFLVDKMFEEDIRRAWIRQEWYEAYRAVRVLKQNAYRQKAWTLLQKRGYDKVEDLPLRRIFPKETTP